MFTRRRTDITGLTRGNDATLTFTISTPLALATAKWVAKRATKILGVLTPTGSEIITKVVTTSLTGDGQITAAGPPNAEVKIILSKTNTALFSATSDYLWDLEVFDGTGKATTPIGGQVVINERVRTATG